MNIKRILGIVGMSAGGLGGIVCLVLIVAVWIGHGALNAQVAALATVVDNGLVRANEGLAQVSAPLERARAAAQQAAAEAERIGQPGTIQRRVVQELNDRFDRDIGARYVQIRESHIGVRERSGALIDTISALNRIPGVNLQQLPVEQLQAIDDQLREVDATLTGMRTDRATMLPLAQMLQRIGAAATQVEDTIGRITARVSALETRLKEAQASVIRVRETLQGWITFGAILLTLALLYGVFLHVVLFVQARVWFNETPISASPLESQLIGEG
jgi:hypothetical protein